MNTIGLQEVNMEKEIIITKESNGIAMVILNRPDRHNAFNESLINQLIDAIHVLENDAEVGAVIVNANGKNFSAGADLDWMKKMAQFSEAENLKDAQQLATLLKLLHGMTKPTIALAKGITMGGGIGLLACCDIVIAAQTARFCFSEVKLGLVPATIAPYIIKAMGARTALYYFLTAKIFTASDAQQLNLIHEMVSEEDLISYGREQAISLLKNGPNALALTKQLVTQCSSIDNTLIQETARLIARVRSSQEAQEGLNAFFEKRVPKW